jgi:hypothetical protein
VEILKEFVEASLEQDADEELIPECFDRLQEPLS